MTSAALPLLALLLALAAASQAAATQPRPYWPDMAAFLEAMTGVSDASQYIDAARAAGADLQGFAGTLLVPLNKAFAAGLAAHGSSPSQLQGHKQAAAALVRYHMSATLLLAPSAGAAPSLLATMYGGKELTVGSALQQARLQLPARQPKRLAQFLTTADDAALHCTRSGPSFSGDSGTARKVAVYYVGAGPQAISTAIYLVDALLLPDGLDLAAGEGPASRDGTAAPSNGSSTTSASILVARKAAGFEAGPGTAAAAEEASGSAAGGHMMQQWPATGLKVAVVGAVVALVLAVYGARRVMRM